MVTIATVPKTVKVLVNDVAYFVPI